jgi:hypothetical protein
VNDVELTKEEEMFLQRSPRHWHEDLLKMRNFFNEGILPDGSIWAGANGVMT